MVRSLPHDVAHRGRTGCGIRRQGRHRQVRRRGERRHHDEVRREEHPDDRLPQGRRAGRQAGRRMPEGCPEGRRSRSFSDAACRRLPRAERRGVFQGGVYGAADSGDGCEPRAAGQHAAGRGDSAHARTRGDRDVPEPSAGLRTADPLPAQPHRRRPLRRSRDARTSIPITIERERNYHHGVLKSEAFLVSKAREMDRGGDGRMPLLRQCGERCRITAISRTSSSARSPTGSRPKGWSRRWCSSTAARPACPWAWVSTPR